MENKILTYIVETFGFKDWSDYTNSIIHYKEAGIFLSSSLIVSTFNAAIRDYLGLKPVLVCAVILLLLLELGTGLMSISKKKEKFQSKKFSRFALKAFMWIAFIYILYSFREQFIDTNKAAFELFDWAHTGLLCYMCLEYLISVDENVAVITGKPNTFLQMVIKKLKSFLNIKDEE